MLSGLPLWGRGYAGCQKIVPVIVPGSLSQVQHWIFELSRRGLSVLTEGVAASIR